MIVLVDKHFIFNKVSQKKLTSILEFNNLETWLKKK